jgi:hypothetical protein
MRRILVVVFALVASCSLFASGQKPAPALSAGELTGEVNIFALLPDNPDIVVNWVKTFNEKYPAATDVGHLAGKRHGRCVQCRG